MHGNVWEWVEDCHHDYVGAPTDGSAYVDGRCKIRMMRSGAWNELGGLLRSANRGGEPGDYRTDKRGFRIARMLPRMADE